MDVTIASEKHLKFAEQLSVMIEKAAKERGTGIANRSPDYIRSKIQSGTAVISVDGDQVAGFCYIESWAHGKYVANSGLIVNPAYRKSGLARKIKKKIFELSRSKYPEARIFGITTSLAVMKINADLGYRPVTFSELTTDPQFWNGCKSCKNFDILTRTNQSHCLCTGMLFDPNDKNNKASRSERWKKFLSFLDVRKLKRTKVKQNQ
jgi:hypothetical protein